MAGDDVESDDDREIAGDVEPACTDCIDLESANQLEVDCAADGDRAIAAADIQPAAAQRQCAAEGETVAAVDHVERAQRDPRTTAVVDQFDPAAEIAGYIHRQASEIDESKTVLAILCFHPDGTAKGETAVAIEPIGPEEGDFAGYGVGYAGDIAGTTIAAEALCADRFDLYRGAIGGAQFTADRAQDGGAAKARSAVAAIAAKCRLIGFRTAGGCRAVAAKSANAVVGEYLAFAAVEHQIDIAVSRHQFDGAASSFAAIATIEAGRHGLIAELRPVRSGPALSTDADGFQRRVLIDLEGSAGRDGQPGCAALAVAAVAAVAMNRLSAEAATTDAGNVQAGVAAAGAGDNGFRQSTARRPTGITVENAAALTAGGGSIDRDARSDHRIDQPDQCRAAFGIATDGIDITRRWCVADRSTEGRYAPAIAAAREGADIDVDGIDGSAVEIDRGETAGAATACTWCAGAGAVERDETTTVAANAVGTERQEAGVHRHRAVDQHFDRSAKAIPANAGKAERRSFAATKSVERTRYTQTAEATSTDREAVTRQCTAGQRQKRCAADAIAGNRRGVAVIEVGHACAANTVQKDLEIIDGDRAAGQIHREIATGSGATSSGISRCRPEQRHAGNGATLDCQADAATGSVSRIGGAIAEIAAGSNRAGGGNSGVEIAIGTDVQITEDKA